MAGKWKAFCDVVKLLNVLYARSFLIKKWGRLPLCLACRGYCSTRPNLQTQAPLTLQISNDRHQVLRCWIAVWA